MSKGNPKNKNQQDRAAREAERRRREEERARERETKEAEKAREREEREREKEDQQEEVPQVPGRVLASVQLFHQMPPGQLYVLDNGQTIATPETSVDLVQSVRQVIWDHFVALTPPDAPAPEEEQSDAEIPVDPSDAYEALGDRLDEDAQQADEDGLTPEDYTALEAADHWATATVTEDTPPRQASGITGTQEQNVTITVPDGIDPAALTTAIQNAITNATKGGI